MQRIDQATTEVRRQLAFQILLGLTHGADGRRQRVFVEGGTFVAPGSRSGLLRPCHTRPGTTHTLRLRGRQRRLVDLPVGVEAVVAGQPLDRKSTRLNSSHSQISYAVFCL